MHWNGWDIQVYTQFSKSYSSSLRVSVNTVSFNKVTYFLEESACGSLYMDMFVNYTNHPKIQILWYRPDQRTWRKKEIRHFFLLVVLCLLSSFLCGRRNALSLWAVKTVTFLVFFFSYKNTGNWRRLWFSWFHTMEMSVEKPCLW